MSVNEEFDFSLASILKYFFQYLHEKVLFSRMKNSEKVDIFLIFCPREGTFLPNKIKTIEASTFDAFFKQEETPFVQILYKNLFSSLAK